MDSVSPEDAKSSSDDADKRQPQVYSDDAGTGRFYECVFCKRGFTTAQALGGHMNIHRKDKARYKQPNTSSTPGLVPVEDYSRSGILHPSSVHSFPGQTYFHVSESSVGEAAVRNPWPLSLFEENPHMNLSLNIGTSDVEEKGEEKGKDEEDGEVDLTLRLGHDP